MHACSTFAPSPFRPPFLSFSLFLFFRGMIFQSGCGSAASTQEEGEAGELPQVQSQPDLLYQMLSQKHHDFKETV